MRLDEKRRVYITKRHSYDHSVKAKWAFFEQYRQAEKAGATPRGLFFVSDQEVSQDPRKLTNCSLDHDVDIVTSTPVYSIEYSGKCITRGQLRNLKKVFRLSMKELSEILEIPGRKLFHWLQKDKNDSDTIPIMQTQYEKISNELLATNRLSEKEKSNLVEEWKNSILNHLHQKKRNYLTEEGKKRSKELPVTMELSFDEKMSHSVKEWEKIALSSLSEEEKSRLFEEWEKTTLHYLSEAEKRSSKEWPANVELLRAKMDNITEGFSRLEESIRKVTTTEGLPKRKRAI
ncbi:MAG TPA: hypothetical protein VN445_02380 [Rectinemataceae bacterium]|nr:hypothetical protein [Rectinemataceae bacterium]